VELIGDRSSDLQFCNPGRCMLTPHYRNQKINSLIPRICVELASKSCSPTIPPLAASNELVPHDSPLQNDALASTP